MRHFVAVLTAVWLGLHMSFGYIVAPILFRHLEKMQAGNMAGSLFTWSHLAGIVVWAWVYVFCVQDNRRCYRPARRTYAAALLLVLLLINQFLITPVIVALKTNTHYWLHDLIGGSFSAWHGASSMVYLCCSLLGLALCAILVRWDAAYR